MGSKSKHHDHDEEARGVAGGSNAAVVKTFRFLAAIGRWLMVFAILIIFVGALSYIFKFELPQIAVDILAGVLVVALLITSIMLMRVLWWHSGGKKMDFHEAWKLFAMKVQIFLSMIVALLALPTFVSLVRVEQDANGAHMEALKLIKKAKKLNEDRARAD